MAFKPIAFLVMIRALNASSSNSDYMGYICESQDKIQLVCICSVR